MERKIYFDNAATTSLLPNVKEVIIKHLDDYGNPSSKHSKGRAIRRTIEECRRTVAKAINAEPDEIFFTSGASEANNWVLNNFVYIITDYAEHHSVLKKVKNNIFNVIETDMCNGVSVDQYKSIIKNCPHGSLTSIQFVNNELGFVNPIGDIIDLAHKKNMPIHIDATQAIPHIKIDVKQLDMDFMSFSGHKFGALKGIGVLYAKREQQHFLKNLIYGGSQENGMRGGTENVLGIISLAEAIRSIDYNRTFIEEYKNFKELLDINGVRFNTLKENVETTGILSITIEGIESESIMLLLEMENIYISSGSACAGKREISHVLKAVGMSDEEARSTVRISMNNNTTTDDVKLVVKKIKEKIKILSQKY